MQMGLMDFDVSSALENLENKYEEFNNRVLNIITYVIVFCHYLHSSWCKVVIDQCSEFMIL
jgi:hypothetical protein